MKNLIMLSLLLTMGCVNTDPLDRTSYFDPDKTYCPNGTIQYCTGANKRNLTCHCVNSISLPDRL